MLISKDVILTYTNSRGLALDLSALSAYSAVEVRETVENEINSDKQGNLDGESFISQTLGPRRVEISGFFNAYSGGAVMQRHMERVFNVTLPGTLRYYNNQTNIWREIDCLIDELPEIALEKHTITFDIQLTALKPFWRGRGIYGSISTIMRMGKFPLVIPPEKFLFGYRADVLENVIDNIGDVSCGALFTIVALGSVVNPLITHLDSGATIQTVYTMEKDDALQIYCYPDRADVIITPSATGVPINAMKFLTDETRRQFFTLYAGINTVGYNADVNVSNMDVRFEATDLYLGV